MTYPPFRSPAYLLRFALGPAWAGGPAWSGAPAWLGGPAWAGGPPLVVG
ncbi:MAG: hypothetical protein M3220_21170 [Chloroflexota bacterium]|nr:hypothetical protein [Chloroflexota bacterium]